MTTGMDSSRRVSAGVATVIGTAAAIYLAVLPMAKTMALRNLALATLLVGLAWHWRQWRPAVSSLKIMPLPFLVWAAYLLLFPVFSSSPMLALESLEGQWARGLLAMLAGAGTAAVFGNKKYGSVLFLGVVSAAPIAIHLYLFFAQALRAGGLPWGYWGRETHHADLGYAAGQVVIFACVAIAVKRPGIRLMALGLILASLASTVFAHSRAGQIFCGVGGALVFCASLLSPSGRKRGYLSVGLSLLLVISFGAVAIAAQQDARWRTMTSELEAGFYGNALSVLCTGPAVIEAQVVAEFGDQAPKIIDSVRNGDAIRVMVLRAGYSLAQKYPWGSDGSRQAFQHVLARECPAPVLKVAHTHNGWLDTVLALGWLGALLYLWVLAYFAAQGLKAILITGVANEWALVLVALSSFWMLRGFTDTVFRDHMLEMQGFVLSYALVALKRAAHADPRSGSSKPGSGASSSF